MNVPEIPTQIVVHESNNIFAGIYEYSVDFYRYDFVAHNYAFDFTFEGERSEPQIFDLSTDFSYLMVCDSDSLEVYGWDTDRYKIQFQYLMEKGF